MRVHCSCMFFNGCTLHRGYGSQTVDVHLESLSASIPQVRFLKAVLEDSNGIADVFKVGPSPFHKKSSQHNLCSGGGVTHSLFLQVRN